MKKFGFIALALSLGLMAAACGNKEEPKNDGNKQEASTDSSSDASTDGAKGNKEDSNTPKIGGSCSYYGGFSQCVENKIATCSATDSDDKSGVFVLDKACSNDTVCAEHHMNVGCYKPCNEGDEKELQKCQADEFNEEFTAEYYECADVDGQFLMVPSFDKEYCSSCGDDGECIKDFDDGADLMPTEECNISYFAPRCEEDDGVYYAFNCVTVTNGTEYFNRVSLKSCKNGCLTLTSSSMFARPSAICNEEIKVSEDDEDLMEANFCYYSLFDYEGQKAIQIYFAQDIEIEDNEVTSGFISGLGVEDNAEGRQVLQGYIDDFACQQDDNLHMFF